MSLSGGVGGGRRDLFHGRLFRAAIAKSSSSGVSLTSWTVAAATWELVARVEAPRREPACCMRFSSDFDEKSVIPDRIPCGRRSSHSTLMRSSCVVEPSGCSIVARAFISLKAVDGLW